MKFSVAIEFDQEAYERSSDIQEFVDRLSMYIQDRDYGSGVEHVTIGLVIIKSRQGYENWFKQRPPRFIKLQKIALRQIRR